MNGRIHIPKHAIPSREDILHALSTNRFDPDLAAKALNCPPAHLTTAIADPAFAQTITSLRNALGARRRSESTTPSKPHPPQRSADSALADLEALRSALRPADSQNTRSLLDIALGHRPVTPNSSTVQAPCASAPEPAPSAKDNHHRPAVPPDPMPVAEPLSRHPATRSPIGEPFSEAISITTGLKRGKTSKGRNPTPESLNSLAGRPFLPQAIPRAA